MYEIHVHVEINAPIARVFDAVSDHEQFFAAPLTEGCRLTTPGVSDRNGIGAIREIDADGQHFVEEVVHFARPRRFDYVVRSVTKGARRLPLEHELGWLEFTATPAGTRVDWRSRFRIGVPVLGLVIERVVGPKGAAAFEKLLLRAKANLESGAEAAGASAN
jgi:uncharacterized protein YndB with AHSA1/START domain